MMKRIQSSISVALMDINKEEIQFEYQEKIPRRFIVIFNKWLMEMMKA